MLRAKSLVACLALAAANKDCYVHDDCHIHECHVQLPDWTGLSQCTSLFLGDPHHQAKLTADVQARLVKRFEDAVKLGLRTPHTLVINNGALDAKLLSRLVVSLENNTSVESLDLTANGLDDALAAKLGKALRRNRKLRTVTLHGNSVGSEGAAALARALHSNAALELLDLGKNAIGNHGARSFAEALGHNDRLRTLILSANDIGDRGAAALAGAIEWQAKEEEGLTTLDVSANRIGESGGDALATALETSHVVGHLSLGDNKDVPHHHHKRIHKWTKASPHARAHILRRKREEEFLKKGEL